MALIKCPECSHEISSMAHSCPHCGYSLESKSTPSNTSSKKIQTIQGTEVFEVVAPNKYQLPSYAQFEIETVTNKLNSQGKTVINVTISEPRRKAAIIWACTVTLLWTAEIDAQQMQQQSINTKSGCYIATSVYGSYDCPEVWTLRRYRDTVLSNTSLGRIFICCYYAISPTLVKRLGHVRLVSALWKKILDQMVRKLHNDGISNTPYQDS